jgi:gliding motility-associated-like protein
MRKLIFILALWSPSIFAQCDVSISSWNASSGDITIEAINSENCGCNEFTTEGNTCENSVSPHVNNNTTVSHIVLGLHVEGLDYNWMDCLATVNHAGWTFKVFSLFGNQILESGDTWSANVYDTGASTNDCWEEILSNDTMCTELVIWQINLSRTSPTEEGGWAVNGGGFTQTQNYPDVDLSNNSATNCALPVCDTIVVIEVDTLIEYVQLPPDTIILIEVDTLIEYVQLPPDTVPEYIYLTDTIYSETLVYEYIYVYNTDTITEYNTETVYIDCDTGELCGDEFICDETSIFAPNVVTPNGDGWNDTWQVISDGGCWSQWEVRVYNRWGGLVWISSSSLDEWEANVASGVYVYTITAHSSQNASVFEFNGTVTVLY